jgi:hypothetical protein
VKTAGSAQTIGAIDAAAPVQSFVINLVASTSPMALSHPSSPELKRFTFFVSRQREDGRERFRLHMGYFASQEDAEALLESVRDVYPAAWAGPAPTTGMGRRGRIVPTSVVAATPPVAPVAAAAAIEPMSNVRDVLAQLSEVAPTLPQVPAVPVAPPVVAPVAPMPVQALPAVAVPAVKPADAELSGAAALQLLETDPAARHPRLAPMPAQATAVPAMPTLQSPFEGLENEPEVRLVTPEDTQTLTDIKLDRQNNAPPCFAVQLIWSAVPIEIGALPHLAVFDAYTLYNVEGNRQGRKWFGLRLGFFSDPNSASQVANYVRSEYKAVAVVPVAVKERDRARGSDAAPSTASAEGPRKTTDNEFKREPMAGFELLIDDRPVPARRDFEDAARGKAKVAAPVPRLEPKSAPPAPAAQSRATAANGTGKRVVVRRRPPAVPAGRTVSAGVGGAEVLESTLEILGASTLSLDEGTREIIPDAAASKPVRKPSESTSRFSKLLNRLSGG